MVVKYNVFGASVGSHHLAIGVLSSMFAGTYLAMRGGGAKKDTKTPPVNASSKEEENFIADFLKEAEQKTPAKH